MTCRIRVFADVIKVKFEMRSYWIRVGLKSDKSVPVRQKRRHRNIEKMAAETGVMCL